MSEKELSKFISLILRHKPEVIGISLDEHGWADVDELIEGINKSYLIDRTKLEKIVSEDEKKRYSFSEDGKLIRANQGHSIQVDVELEKKNPPDVLWHGTGKKYVDSINERGLIPKSRLYVHLSAEYDTAVNVGKRHGEPVVYKINARRMVEEGYNFYQSVNGVWLISSVPEKYLEKVTKRIGEN